MFESEPQATVGDAVLWLILRCHLIKTLYGVDVKIQDMEYDGQILHVDLQCDLPADLSQTKIHLVI
jgi:hypothetical protein